MRKGVSKGASVDGHRVCCGYDELYGKGSDKYEASNKCWTAAFWDSYFNK